MRFLFKGSFTLTDPINPICGNCKWFYDIQANGYHGPCCTRRAPICAPAYPIMGEFTSRFPSMNHTQSCGDFEVKP